MPHVLPGTQTVTLSSIFMHFVLDLSHQLTCTLPINSPCGFSTSCTSEQLGLFFLNQYATGMSPRSSQSGTSPSKLAVNTGLTHQWRV